MPSRAFSFSLYTTLSLSKVAADLERRTTTATLTNVSGAQECKAGREKTRHRPPMTSKLRTSCSSATPFPSARPARRDTAARGSAQDVRPVEPKSRHAPGRSGRE